MKIIVVGNFARWLVNFRGHLLTRMVENGHQVYACAPDASPKIQKILVDMGVTYVEIPLNRSSFNPFIDLKLLFFLVKLFRKTKPDIFFGYTIKPIIFGSIAAKISGIPLLFSMIEGLGYLFDHRKHHNLFLKGLIYFFYAVSMRLSNKVFFLNSNDLDYFLKKKLLPCKRKGILLNGIGVDLDEYPYMPSPKKISFLFAARLLLDKGIQEYVNSAKIIKNKYPDITFKIAGWIDDNPSSITLDQLKSWIDEGSIEYLGNLKNIKAALASSSIFVLPTYYKEGLPRSILEAMSMGRPVITTDIPGCRDAISNCVNGFLVPVKESNILAEKMEVFIKDPSLTDRMGKIGRQIAEKRFDVNKVNTIIVNEMNI